MPVLGTLAFMVIPAFMAGVVASLVYNHMALRKWRKSRKPQYGVMPARKEAWYHTWQR